MAVGTRIKIVDAEDSIHVQWTVDMRRHTTYWLRAGFAPLWSNG
jgi:hypothetical protein